MSSTSNATTVPTHIPRESFTFIARYYCTCKKLSGVVGSSILPRNVKWRMLIVVLGIYILLQLLNRYSLIASALLAAETLYKSANFWLQLFWNKIRLYLFINWGCWRVYLFYISKSISILYGFSIITKVVIGEAITREVKMN